MPFFYPYYTIMNIGRVRSSCKNAVLESTERGCIYFMIISKRCFKGNVALPKNIRIINPKLVLINVSLINVKLICITFVLYLNADLDHFVGEHMKIMSTSLTFSKL